jgi:glycosyltransferase involved in cell wall biosynthesis
MVADHPMPILQTHGAPRVSVVIPIHNAASYLSDTLMSVLQQCVQDWELVAVDDGSTDSSAEIVLNLARKDTRVTLLRQDHAGVSSARNRGVAESHAPLIAFLDADDLWHPNKLCSHLEYHWHHPGLAMSFSQVEFLTPCGIPTGVLTPHPGQPLRPVDLLSENPTTTTSNWVVRRDVFEAVGGFLADLNYSEDLEWLLRLACDGRWPIAPIQRVLTYYRTSTDGLSSSLACMEQGWLRLIREVSHYAPELVEREFAAAQAVHLRYLARRSLRLRGDPWQGADFLRRAFGSHWRRLVLQPRRSFGTAIAVISRLMLDRACQLTRSRTGFKMDRSQPTPVSPARMSDSLPLVSVVIPLYNAANTVSESITSVLTQTYSNLEIIVVDDGSTDNGMAIVKQIWDPRLRVISQRNRGLAGARNSGIRCSHGTIVAFLDSDDFWSPDKIELHIQHLNNNPQVGISFSCSAFIDDKSQPLGIYQFSPLQQVTPERILCRNPIGNGSCAVVRRAALDAIRVEANLYGSSESFWFDEGLRQSEDIECWLRIALQTNWRIEGIYDVLTFYRVNSGGLSSDINQQFSYWQKVIIKTASYAPELIAAYGMKALGYQLRYLARWALHKRDIRTGMWLLRRAIYTYPSLLVEEPFRTTITVTAGYLIMILPARWVKNLEGVAMHGIGMIQFCRIKLHPRVQKSLPIDSKLGL